MRTMLTAALGVALSIPVAAPIAAQSMQPHLDSQRWTNTLRHQQRLRAKAQAKHDARAAAPITKAERLDALVRHRAEYNRIAKADGTQGAERWLEAKILASR